MHLNAELLFRRYAVRHFDDAEVIELGPGRPPSVFQTITRAKSWTTADISGSEFDDVDVDIRMRDENHVPVPEASFDVVFSCQVLEHVRRPWLWMAELSRIVRPGGTVVTINPASWPFHEVPIDCWRIYPDGMRALSEDAGLEVELCTFEALEPPRTGRTYPGTGALAAPGGPSLKSRLKRLISWPTPVAYDTITIAKRSMHDTELHRMNT